LYFKRPAVVQVHLCNPSTLKSTDTAGQYERKFEFEAHLDLEYDMPTDGEYKSGSLRDITELVANACLNAYRPSLVVDGALFIFHCRCYVSQSALAPCVLCIVCRVISDASIIIKTTKLQVFFSVWVFISQAEHDHSTLIQHQE
jgi:hypothetical protein